MNIELNNLKQHKTTDRVYILASGPSVLDITKKQWKNISKYNTIGFNHWYAHDFEPTFYDLSYFTHDNHFDSPENDMLIQALSKCKNSKFIVNYSNKEKYKTQLSKIDHTFIHINHFDFIGDNFDYLDKSEIGNHATYWSDNLFTHFNVKKGSLKPNDNFFFKSRGQLFTSLQLAHYLGYKDIRFIGVDLTSENKFQDLINSAPLSSRSVGKGGEVMQDRINALNDAKNPNESHSTAQGTKDKDYMPIHKLIALYKDKYLYEEGIKLTTSNSNSLLVEAGIDYLNILENMKIPKITFCIPSKSNLRYLKACIPSIRKNAYRNDHEIIVFVDQDEDGTIKWLDEVKNQYDVQYYVNPKLGKELFGIGRAYDFCVMHSNTDIFMIFHADMMLGKNADLHAYNRLKPKTVVCSTRVEPPIHPNAGEKILMDFGSWPEEFKEKEFDKYVNSQLEETKTTEGIFAPWMMYKNEFVEILGGHDPIMHSCREDSDIFNRMLLADFKFIQPWNSLVYHLTGRGAGSFDGDKERHEQWKKDMSNSTLEFIRKWGTNVNHTPLMKPIVHPVYKKSVIINNSNPQLEAILEPWFNGGDGIIVEVDAKTFTQQDFQYIQQLSEILAESVFLEEDMGEQFEVGNLKLTINNIETYENKLIKWKKE